MDIRDNSRLRQVQKVVVALQGFFELVSLETYSCSDYFSNCYLIFTNFQRPVLGCAEEGFEKILLRKLLTRSLRFANVCTAPNSKLQLKFVKYVRILQLCFQTITDCFYLLSNINQFT